MTPNRLVAMLRAGAAVSAIGLAVVFLGPFTWLVDVFHVSDKVAHATVFFGVTLTLFAIAPKWRRTDLALTALGLGVLIELAQGLTGRSVSLLDLAANATGILAAVLPGMVEQLRRYMRTSPDTPFAEIRTTDRRRRPTRASTAAEPAQTPLPLGSTTGSAG